MMCTGQTKESERQNFDCSSADNAPPTLERQCGVDSCPSFWLTGFTQISFNGFAITANGLP